MTSDVVKSSNLVCAQLESLFLILGDSQASECYVPTFRNSVFSIFRAGVICVPAYTSSEDGTDRVFRNVGT